MLAEFITTRGETRRAWARRLDISESYLSDLLSGKKTPSLALAARIERETGGAVTAVSWVGNPGGEAA